MSSYNTKLVANICSHLLDSKCYNNLIVDKEGEDSPLIYFCTKGIVAIVEMLIGCNVDVNHAGEGGATALHHVISLQGNFHKHRLKNSKIHKVASYAYFWR